MTAGGPPLPAPVSTRPVAVPPLPAALPPRPAPSRSYAAWLVFTATALLLAGSVALIYLAIRATRGVNLAPGWAGELFPWLAGATVFVLVVLVTPRRRPAARGVHPSWPVAALPVLAVGAILTPYNGYLPVIVRWAVVLSVGMIMGLAIVRLAVTVITRQRLGWRRLAALAPLAALAAVPWGGLGQPYSQVDWFSLFNYVVRVDGLLGLLLVAAAALALRELGQAPLTSPEAINGYRRMGSAIWFIALGGSYTLAGRYTLAGLAATAAAAVGAVLLLPAGQAARAAFVLGQSARQQRQAVDRTLRAGAARRLLPVLSKSMRDKVASGDVSFAAAQQRIAGIERQAAGPAGDPEVSAEQRGFGALASDRPWERARWGLLTGTVIGAPWVVLGLVGTSLHLRNDSYPELAVLAAVAPLVIRWAGYGLLFGYFFPLLRGATGFSKGIWFLAAAVIPAVCSTLASAHTTARQWDSTVLLIVQLFGFALTLGVLADRAVLRKYGIPTSRLVDLHNFWTVSAWASSVAVATATGIATVIIAGLQPFVIGVTNPAPTPPPAATSTAPPGH